MLFSLNKVTDNHRAMAPTSK